PPYKRVAGVTVTREPLPRTTTRKLKRAPLRAWVQASRAADRVALQPRWSPADRAWADEPAHARALDLIAARVHRPRADIHPDLLLDIDLGLDSLARLSLLSDLHAPAVSEVLATLQSVRYLVEAATAAPSAGDGGDAVAMAGAGPPPRRSLALTALAFVLLRGVRLLARGLLRLRVEGAEHLRPPAAALVCSNHQ